MRRQFRYLEPDGLDQAAAEGGTDGEPEAEGDVPDGVDPAVDGRVPDVHQEAQLGHHAGVHHADAEAQGRHGHDQVVRVGGERDLRCRKGEWGVGWGPKVASFRVAK